MLGQRKCIIPLLYPTFIARDGGQGNQRTPISIVLFSPCSRNDSLRPLYVKEHTHPSHLHGRAWPSVHPLHYLRCASYEAVLQPPQSSEALSLLCCSCYCTLNRDSRLRFACFLTQVTYRRSRHVSQQYRIVEAVVANTRYRRST